MPAPLGKRTVFDGARRPWLTSGPERAEPGRPVSAKEITEREICLACTEPDCPSDTCPLRKGRKKKREPPEEFLRWAWGPMTNREWAEALGVSTYQISKWRAEYGLVRR